MTCVSFCNKSQLFNFIYVFNLSFICNCRDQANIFCEKIILKISRAILHKNVNSSKINIFYKDIDSRTESDILHKSVNIKGRSNLLYGPRFGGWVLSCSRGYVHGDHANPLKGLGAHPPPPPPDRDS